MFFQYWWIIVSDKNGIIWKEIENLKPDTLEKVCRTALRQMVDPNDSIDDFQYVPVAEKNLEKERIIKKGPVEFLHGLQYTLELPIIKCHYVGTEFYLCHGNDSHVFRVFHDLFGSYYFRSGPHRVEWI